MTAAACRFPAEPFLVHQLLEQAALQEPGREAVVLGEASLTYAELLERSRALARVLREAGLRRGGMAGILLRKSLSSIVGVYGILMAGAAYVPVDPMLPDSRVKHILDNCGILHLVASEECLSRRRGVLKDRTGLLTVLLEDGQPPTAPPLAGEWVPECFPDTYPAYVLHTSGSTGLPKGVVITHLNSLTFVKSAARYFGISAEDRLACHAPLHFDLSVFDIFVAAAAGATLVLVPEGDSLFPVQLGEFIRERRITVWNSVSSALSQLADRGLQGDDPVPKLRLVIFSGEVLPRKFLEKLKVLMPAATFCNIYGQTEANSSTCYRVGGLPEDPMWKIPVGRALPNFEVFLMGDDGKEVTRPVAEGEIYVNAGTVAMGYINMPGLTAERFVTDPRFPSTPRTVYRTGDVGHYDEEGNLVFLHRKDSMVKVRGHRVELGEVERTVLSHESVELAVVTAVPDEIASNRIAVFVSWRGGARGDVRNVKSFCERNLPRYMLPSAIWTVEEWPLTPNDKIDRRALQALAKRNFDAA